MLEVVAKYRRSKLPNGTHHERCEVIANTWIAEAQKCGIDAGVVSLPTALVRGSRPRLIAHIQADGSDYMLIVANPDASGPRVRARELLKHELPVLT